MESFKRTATSDLSSRKISLALVQSRLNGEDGDGEAPRKGVSYDSGGDVGQCLSNVSVVTYLPGKLAKNTDYRGLPTRYQFNPRWSSESAFFNV